MKIFHLSVILLFFMCAYGDPRNPNIQGMLEKFLKNNKASWKQKHTNSIVTSADIKLNILSTYELKGIMPGQTVIGVDCADILKKDPSTKNQDGVFTINPNNTSPRKVFCDMTTKGGGWTVIQNRIDGSTDFYRTWNDYKEGFGNSSYNYWIGNDMIHLLTKHKTQKLRVELQRFSGEKGYAEYSTFAVGSETSKYKLTVYGFQGNIGDHLEYHNGMKFSTWDQDNDGNSGKCSWGCRGAWWYKSCYMSNLNGKYIGSSASDVKSNNWRWPTKDAFESLKTTRMLIRPANL